MKQMDKYFVAVPPERVGLLVGKELRERTETCVLCGDKCRPDDMSAINEIGTAACPRCVFLLALYLKKGIKKKLTSGCLMVHKLNAEFQRINRH